MIEDATDVTSPQGSLLVAVASFGTVLLVFSCLYCFKSQALDDDEEKEVAHEKRQINRGGSLDSRLSTEREGRMGWGRLHNWFSTSESKEMEEPDSGNTPHTLYEKPPMGTMSVSRVQPPLQFIGAGPSSSFDKRDSFSSLVQGGQGDRTRLASTPVIPEAFKQSFDYSCEVSDDFLTENLGKLQFSTIYVFGENTLSVQIIKATDLPAMDLSGTSDPFVKCFLLPDRKRKLETKTKRKTLNPVWKERLSFEGLAYEKIKQRVLYLQVLDYDRFSRNDPIGEICLPLRTVDLSEERCHDLPLQVCKNSNKRGELLISLCYQPIEGLLHVDIVKGRNMKPMDINGTSDPYVKLWMLYRGKKVEKKKTPVIKNSLNPKFDEKFTFQAPMGKLREIQIEIAAMDYDSIGRNDTIGKIYLGHKSAGLEKQHWKDMLANVRTHVAQWHVLKV